MRALPKREFRITQNLSLNRFTPTLQSRLKSNYGDLLTLLLHLLYICRNRHNNFRLFWRLQNTRWLFSCLLQLVMINCHVIYAKEIIKPPVQQPWVLPQIFASVKVGARTNNKRFHTFPYGNHILCILLCPFILFACVGKLLIRCSSMPTPVKNILIDFDNYRWSLPFNFQVAVGNKKDEILNFVPIKSQQINLQWTPTSTDNKLA